MKMKMRKLSVWKKCANTAAAAAAAAAANTPFTRSSWLDELLYVSWTSQLDVCSTV